MRLSRLRSWWDRGRPRRRARCRRGARRAGGAGAGSCGRLAGCGRAAALRRRSALVVTTLLERDAGPTAGVRRRHRPVRALAVSSCVRLVAEPGLGVERVGWGRVAWPASRWRALAILLGAWRALADERTDTPEAVAQTERALSVRGAPRAVPPPRTRLERPMIDREQVLHVARLARLELSDDEVEQMATELSGILAHVDRMSELDLEGVAAHDARRRGHRRAARRRAAPSWPRETHARDRRRRRRTAASSSRARRRSDRPPRPHRHGGRGAHRGGRRRRRRALRGLPRTRGGRRPQRVHLGRRRPRRARRPHRPAARASRSA